jgi:phosphatidate cytidylyltransferase
MPRQKGVKFQHRNGNGNGETSHHRRASSSTVSDSASEPPSPRKEQPDGSANGNLVKGEKPAGASEYEKKKQTFITRMIWTLVMIGGFFFAMFAGHIYVLMVITAVQIVSFSEVIAIAQVPTKQKNLPLTTSLNWYFLAITMYFLYGESVIYYFKHILLVDKVLLPFATHHRFISFMMYIFGTLMSVVIETTADLL